MDGLGPTRSPRIIPEGTQAERDHYGELFVRFLFEGPHRTGMLHADPHPGNFRILPAADGGLGRLGVLDFGAVAAAARAAAAPRAMGRLMRVAIDSERTRSWRCCGEEGFIKDKISVDPALLPGLPRAVRRARGAPRRSPLHAASGCA